MFKRFISIIIALVLLVSNSACAQEVNFSKLDSYNFTNIQKLKSITEIDPTNVEKTPVKLVRVVDGDTVRLLIDGVEESVRLIGIDTPESVHRDKSKNSPYGDFASDFTEKLLKSNPDKLTLELDVQERDRYGRVLGYLWLEDVMVNEFLLSAGYAQVATYPPNTRYVDEFLQAQERARKNQAGFWANDSDQAFTKLEKRTQETKKHAEKSQTKEDTSKNTSQTQNQPDQEDFYIGNKNSKIFHRPNCSSAKSIKEENKVTFQTRQEAIDAGYRPCKKSNP